MKEVFGCHVSVRSACIVHIQYFKIVILQLQKRLRRLDRDILRKFLIINDSIEEQKWMIEEKQEAIKQNLSEEGEEDAVEIVQSFAFPEERDDDEESIQSVLSRQNSGCGVYEDDLTVPISQNDLIKEQDEDEDVAPFNHPASTESEMTSSESVLSISEASSTLSSTTSVSTSQKSNSPMTSNLSGSSSACSSADSNDVAHESNNSTARQQYLNENDDIESYCRMNGSSGASRSGSYTYMARSHSINDTDRTYHYSTYSDVPLDNGYGDKRNSFSVQTKSTGHEYASRKDLVNRSYNGPYAHQNMYGRSAYSQSRPRSASAAYNDVHDIRNRVQRISVRPDGSHELAVSALGALRRPHSATDKNSAVYRLLQHPLQQKHARMNIRRHHSSTDNSSPNNYQNEQPSNRLRHNWSFVPIAEQEPDVMYDNGRLISEDSDISSKQDRREYENLIDLSKQQQQSSRRVAAHFRQCPTPRRKASAAGSAGSLTSTSSRTSSSSLASSGSSTSLHSPTKFMTNEADRHHLQSDSRNEQSVWVPRKASPQDNEYIAIPYNKSFPAPFSVSKYHDARRGGAHNLPGPEYSSRPSTKRVVPSYYQTPRDNVPIVSYKPGKTSSKEAVYNWIQTQDDITYL